MYSKYIKKDFFSGIVVFLVALPLCLGIALASGAPLISGLVAGIIGGVIVSLISTSHVSVSGPAAGLTVIVADSINKMGSFENFLCAVIFAGFFQIAFFLFRFGFIANYVPASVIQGMMSAIGAVIILKQIPHALGRDVEHEGNLYFQAPDTKHNTFEEIFSALSSIHYGATTISLISLLILVYWNKIILIPKSIKLIPASLIVVLLSVAINQIFKVYFPGLYLPKGQGHLVEIPSTIGSFGSFLDSLPKANFSYFFSQNSILVGLVLATVASIETLLSIEASEKLDPKKRLVDSNKELLAQGLGNVSSGLLGGLPITSVVVRTTANVNSGCETKLSSIFHGLILLVSVILLPKYLNEIPLSALAAVLIILGVKLCSYSVCKKQYSLGSIQFIPFASTLVAVLLTDLLTGVVIGCVVGLFFVIKNSHHAAFTLVSEDNIHLIRINKDVSFVNKAELKEKLSLIPNDSNLILDGTKASRIDHDIKDVLRDFIESSTFKGINVEIKNIRNVEAINR